MRLIMIIFLISTILRIESAQVVRCRLDLMAIALDTDKTARIQSNNFYPLKKRASMWFLHRAIIIAHALSISMKCNETYEWMYIFPSLCHTIFIKMIRNSKFIQGKLVWIRNLASDVDALFAYGKPIYCDCIMRL